MKIEGESKESKKGTTSYSIVITVLCCIVMGAIGRITYLLGDKENAFDMAILAEIVLLILLGATIRYNQN